jgi:Cu(I)/Ag(I) efflux system membrane protein CusA/SilA
MALPIFGGMLVDPLTTFIVPTLYSAYVEFKMRAGLQDDYWTETENPDRLQEANDLTETSAA